MLIPKHKLLSNFKLHNKVLQCMIIIKITKGLQRREKNGKRLVYKCLAKTYNVHTSYGKLRVSSTVKILQEALFILHILLLMWNLTIASIGKSRKVFVSIVQAL